MSLRISTNTVSLMAQHQMSKSSRELDNSLAQLASGSKFAGTSKDPASQAVAENLKAQTSGLGAAQKNADVAISFVQTAEGSLNEQNNILIRMRELGVQAASDTLSDTERGFLDREFQQLSSEFDRIAKSARFGANPILSGKSQSYEFQVGERGDANSRISFTNDSDATASALGVDGLSVEDKGEARDSLEAIDEALTSLAGMRAKFGATQSRLETAYDFLGGQISSIEEARSKIGDTDVAEAVSQARRGQILQQYQAAVLAQANQSPENALKLIA